MQATLSRQAGKNLQYFVTYTFSKALGTVATSESDGSAWADPVDTRGRSWGVLPFDRTHIVNLSYNYNLPDLAKGAADAIRERVFVPVANVDQDQDGITDRVAIDIVRPKESGPNLKVPAIIDDSPYYTSVGRGNETQFIHTTPNGNADFIPLFVDNYFVPRGYAYIAAEADGTAFSTGCPLHGGPGDIELT